MKIARLLAFLMGSILIIGCAEDYGDDISNIYDELDAIKAQMSQVNTDIGSLRTLVSAVQDNDFVTSVSTVVEAGKEVGCIINFKKSGSVTLRNGDPGKDGYAPVMGVVQQDGVWCWTVDGKLLKDGSGNNVCAEGRDGATPQMKVEGGFWYLSYDNGVSWNRLGRATGSDGDSFFKSVDAVSSDECVFVVLADGTEFTLPKHTGIRIILSEQDDICISPGRTVEIYYTISGASRSPKVSVSTSNGWIADIIKEDDTSGVVSVTAPNPYLNGNVTLLAGDDQHTVMEALSFVPDYSPARVVDLGLSVNWASCNLGAETPEGLGEYFAWGDTEPNSGNTYAWTSYKWRISGESQNDVKLSKYITDSKYGKVDNKTSLELNDDAARVQWAGKWRLPTADEFEELLDHCNWEWTSVNGVYGYKVTSRVPGYRNSSIFLPAAGKIYDSVTDGTGSYGCYWSSSLNSGQTLYSYLYWFGSTGRYNYSYDYRFAGMSVRPVTE